MIEVRAVLKYPRFHSLGRWLTSLTASFVIMVLWGRGFGFHLAPFKPIDSWSLIAFVALAAGIAFASWLITVRDHRTVAVGKNAVTIHTFVYYTFSRNKDLAAAIVAKPWSDEFLMMSRYASLRIPLSEFEDPRDAMRLVTTLHGEARTEYWRPSLLALSLATVVFVMSSIPSLLAYSPPASFGPMIAGGEWFRIFTGSLTNPPLFMGTIAGIWLLVIAGNAHRALGLLNVINILILGIFLGGLFESWVHPSLTANGLAYGITFLAVNACFAANETSLPLMHRISKAWWVSAFGIMVVHWIFGSQSQSFYWGYGGIHLGLFAVGMLIGPRIKRWRWFRYAWLLAVVLLVGSCFLRLDPKASVQRMATGFEDHDHGFNLWLWREATLASASEEQLLWVAEIARARQGQHADLASAARGFSLRRLGSAECVDAYWDAFMQQPQSTYATLLAESLMFSFGPGELVDGLLTLGAAGHVNLVLERAIKGTQLFTIKDGDETVCWVLVRCGDCETRAIELPEILVRSLINLSIYCYMGPDDWVDRCSFSIHQPDHRAKSWITVDR